MSCFPTARPTSSRCGHSVSTGATARNSGPGKSPLLPMPDCASASSVTTSARRSVRPVEEEGSTVTKSTVPAMVVFSPSIGKRVTVRMPDSPAVSFAQLSFRPVPSEVTTPMPVTTTMGLPSLSRGVAMIPPSKLKLLVDRFDEGHAFALPVTGPYNDNLGRSPRFFNLESGRIIRREQRAARDRQRRQRQTERKLGFHGVAKNRSCRAHGEAGVLAQERFFLGGDRFDAGRTGNQVAVVGEHAELRPEGFQRFCHRPRLFALREIGYHLVQPGKGLGATRLRVFF